MRVSSTVRRRTIGHARACLAALLLAGCGGPVTSSVSAWPANETQQSRGQRPMDSYVGWATAGDKPLPVEIYGNPFGPPNPVFAAEVAEIMSGALGSRRLQFVATPRSPAQEAIRTVMVFGPDPGMSHEAACQGDVRLMRPARSGGRVTAFLSFCRWGGALRSVDGEVGGVGSPRDPAFRALIGQMVRDLFQRE